MNVFTFNFVIPAKAGTQRSKKTSRYSIWVPAFAGMTKGGGA